MDQSGIFGLSYHVRPNILVSRDVFYVRTECRARALDGRSTRIEWLPKDKVACNLRDMIRLSVSSAYQIIIFVLAILHVSLAGSSR